MNKELWRLSVLTAVITGEITQAEADKELGVRNKTSAELLQDVAESLSSIKKGKK